MDDIPEDTSWDTLDFTDNLVKMGIGETKKCNYCNYTTTLQTAYDFHQRTCVCKTYNLDCVPYNAPKLTSEQIQNIITLIEILKIHDTTVIKKTLLEHILKIRNYNAELFNIANGVYQIIYNSQKELYTKYDRIVIILKYLNINMDHNSYTAFESIFAIYNRSLSMQM
jgi:hypothetical protein